MRGSETPVTQAVSKLAAIVRTATRRTIVMNAYLDFHAGGVMARSPYHHTTEVEPAKNTE